MQTGWFSLGSWFSQAVWYDEGRYGDCSLESVEAFSLSAGEGNWGTEKSPEVCGGGEDQVEGFWEEPTHWRTVKVFSVICIVTFWNNVLQELYFREGAWRMWGNYASVSLHTGEVLRALGGHLQCHEKLTLSAVPPPPFLLPLEGSVFLIDTGHFIQALRGRIGHKRVIWDSLFSEPQWGSLGPSGGYTLLIWSGYLSPSWGISEYSWESPGHSFHQASKLLGLCVRLVWKNLQRCQDSYVGFADANSKKEGQAIGGELRSREVVETCLSTLISSNLGALLCRGERSVNNFVCLQDAGFNLNMIKLIWFYRLEFLSDRNWWG